MEDANKNHVKSQIYSDRELLLEGLLQEEQMQAAEQERLLERMELEVQGLEMERETFGARVEQSKALSENAFYQSLERERERWKQSSDEIIFDLM
jgi:hypothetical protein